ncbi:MAG: flagellar hook-basal body complex protein FliE [Lachnospiraceae bacterium]|nr:flagellar hook-basal body complex protein FliE [Lachnospiraceae bacterium]
MDIASLYNISSGVVKEAAGQSVAGSSITRTPHSEEFGSFLTTAMENIKTTNAYLSDAENEELRLAMGETDNTHDLTIALGKASTALSYTVAVRDKILEAYKELMQIQI